MAFFVAFVAFVVRFGGGFFHRSAGRRHGRRGSPEGLRYFFVVRVSLVRWRRRRDSRRGDVLSDYGWTNRAVLEERCAAPFSAWR
jgi:hypothetical protein